MGKKRSRDEGSLSDKVMDAASMPTTKKQSISASILPQALPSPQSPVSPIAYSLKEQDPQANILVPSFRDGSTGKAVAADVATARTHEDCIGHWASESSWPREFFDPNMPVSGSSRRSANNAQQPAWFDWSNDAIVPFFERLSVFQRDNTLGLSPSSRETILRLMNTPTTIPTGTDFDDDYVADLINTLQHRTESDIQRDLTHLLVPEAESHARQNKIQLPHLTHIHSSTNNNWTHCQPIVDVMPKPDYTVGFDGLLLDNTRFDKLKQWFNPSQDNGAFRATLRLYFPFLVCELKSDKIGLTYAQRQNLHSSTIILRDLVDLFRAAGQQELINREVLAFTIVHNATEVQLFGHYADTFSSETTYWQITILGRSLLGMDVSGRWDTYKFIKNVYDLWLPQHITRILGAIDRLPAEHETWLRTSALRPPYTRPKNLGSNPGSSAAGSTSYEGRSVAGSSSLAGHSMTET